MDSLPDNVQINSEVFMNQAVSHADDLVPWNIGISHPDIFWDLTGCFSNDLEASDDSVPGVQRFELVSIGGSTLEREHGRRNP